ncbi:MAG: PDZ domain-containing protein, partial [Nitrospirae bacterium]
IFSRSGGYMGIGFAIPSNMAKTVTQSLIKYGKVVRGWLGVSIQEVTPELAKRFDAPDTKGALVSDVVKESPADHAGLKRGDIIRTYDGREVQNPTKLRSLVAETHPGTRVDITVFRDGQEKTLSVKIGELPKHLAARGSVETAGEEHALAGLTVAPVPPGRTPNDEGVLVQEVAPNSRAARAGIRSGDIILEINRKPIRNIDDFAKITEQLKPDDAVLVLLRRGNATIFLSISGR